MISMSEKIANQLQTATDIWKNLVNNRKSDIEKITDVFVRYKSFIQENKELIGSDLGIYSEVDVVATKLNRYHEVTTAREKKNLLNDAYLGLMFDLSDVIDELKVRVAEKVWWWS